MNSHFRIAQHPLGDSAPSYPVGAAPCPAVFVFAADLGHVGSAQQVVPLGASLLRTADIGQTDLGARLEGRGGARWRQVKGKGLKG